MTPKLGSNILSCCCVLVSLIGLAGCDDPSENADGAAVGSSSAAQAAGGTQADARRGQPGGATCRTHADCTELRSCEDQRCVRLPCMNKSDMNGDGKFDEYWVHIWELNSSSLKAATEKGTVKYFRDEAGRYARVEWDLNGNGKKDEEDGFTTWKYDAHGNLVREQSHWADGEVNGRRVHSYDAQGHLLATQIDRNADGQINQCMKFSYDARGRLVQYETDGELFGECDGEPDERIRYARNGHGNVLTEETDRKADGSIDQRISHSYDANGRIVGLLVDMEADGNPDEQTTYKYDGAGDLVALESDEKVDGTIDYRERRKYDARGNLVRTELDLDADGGIDERTRFSYDAEGNRLSIEHDKNGDGKPDSRSLFTYDCWVTGQ